MKFATFFTVFAFIVLSGFTTGCNVDEAHRTVDKAESYRLQGIKTSKELANQAKKGAKDKAADGAKAVEELARDTREALRK
jgi:hypothetical protein